MYEIVDIVTVPNTVLDSHYRLRSLFHLVSSCADGFEFSKDENNISYKPSHNANTQWQTEIGFMIQRYFYYELQLYMPPGVWHLGIHYP